MKRLILVGVIVASMHAVAREEQGYEARLKKETDRLVAEVKSLTTEFRKFITPKKEKKSPRKESVAVASATRKPAPQPVIVETCAHCKDLCDVSKQPFEHVA